MLLLWEILKIPLHEGIGAKILENVDFCVLYGRSLTAEEVFEAIYARMRQNILKKVRIQNLENFRVLDLRLKRVNLTQRKANGIQNE